MMTNDDNPRAFICAYDQATTDLVIPLAALRAAEAELDAERERRRLAAAEAEQARAAEAARKPSLWGRVLAAILFGRRRP